MCLYDSKRFRFTTKPIKIYKITVLNTITPFTKVKIKNRNFTLNGFPRHKDFDVYEFGKGFFHAFTSLEAAKSFKEGIIHDNRYSYSDSDLSIIEGYIPAFTRYAISSLGIVQFGQICARRMVLNI